MLGYRHQMMTDVTWSPDTPHVTHCPRRSLLSDQLIARVIPRVRLNVCIIIDIDIDRFLYLILFLNKILIYRRKRRVEYR